MLLAIHEVNEELCWAKNQTVILWSEGGSYSASRLSKAETSLIVSAFELLKERKISGDNKPSRVLKDAAASEGK